MPRYIDADALMKELGITDPDCEKCEWGHKGFPYCKRDGDFVDACDAICEAPTVDVRENIHGMWIHDEDGNIECSVCGHHGVGDLYCERCGAKMDEGNEE